MLDIRTMVFMGTSVFLVCAILLWLLKTKVGDRVGGVGSWAIASSLQVIGMLLVALRGRIPDLFSILLANLAVQGGIVLIYLGYIRFTGLKRRIWGDFIILAIFVAIHAWFTYRKPDLEARNINLSVCMTLICLQIASVLLASRRDRKAARFCAIINLGYVAINLIRISVTLGRGQMTQDFMHSGQIEALWQLGYQLLYLFQTAGMVYMVLGRMNADLAESEEKFSKAFMSSPCAIVISEVETGRIEEINSGFTSIFGYESRESVGRTATALGIWVDPGERTAIMEATLRSGRIAWRDVTCRDKAGATIHGLAATEMLNFKGRRAVLWTLSDISERKRMEENIRALLKEKETLLREIHHRVKNNLSTVIGFLSLEAAKLEAEGKEGNVFQEAANQVRSMSVLYERIYKTERYEDLPLDEFLAPLVRETLASYAGSDRVALEIDLDPRPIGPKLLVPIGMIATELICNAMKYAFAGREKGRFSVRSSGGEELVLEFKDDGPGPGQSPHSASGLGLTMVRALVEQVGGRFSLEADEGCLARLSVRCKAETRLGAGPGSANQ